MPYLLIRHKVQDYGKWKPLFDSQAQQSASSLVLLYIHI